MKLRESSSAGAFHRGDHRLHHVVHTAVIGRRGQRHLFPEPGIAQLKRVNIFRQEVRITLADVHRIRDINEGVHLPAPRAVYPAGITGLQLILFTEFTGQENTGVDPEVIQAAFR
ncbi:hypothetical protein D9M70_550840 [compost metagenome]